MGTYSLKTTAARTGWITLDGQPKKVELCVLPRDAITAFSQKKMDRFNGAIHVFPEQKAEYDKWRAYQDNGHAFVLMAMGEQLAAERLALETAFAKTKARLEEAKKTCDRLEKEECREGRICARLEEPLKGPMRERQKLLQTQNERYRKLGEIQAQLIDLEKKNRSLLLGAEEKAGVGQWLQTFFDPGAGRPMQIWDVILKDAERGLSDLEIVCRLLELAGFGAANNPKTLDAKRLGGLDEKVLQELERGWAQVIRSNQELMERLGEWEAVLVRTRDQLKEALADIREQRRKERNQTGPKLPLKERLAQMKRHKARDKAGKRAEMLIRHLELQLAFLHKIEDIAAGANRAVESLQEQVEPSQKLEGPLRKLERTQEMRRAQEKKTAELQAEYDGLERQCQSVRAREEKLLEQTNELIGRLDARRKRRADYEKRKVERANAPKQKEAQELHELQCQIAELEREERKNKKREEWLGRFDMEKRKAEERLKELDEIILTSKQKLADELWNPELFVFCQSGQHTPRQREDFDETVGQLADLYMETGGKLTANNLHAWLPRSAKPQNTAWMDRGYQLIRVGFHARNFDRFLIDLAEPPERPGLNEPVGPRIYFIGGKGDCVSFMKNRKYVNEEAASQNDWRAGLFKRVLGPAIEAQKEMDELLGNGHANGNGNGQNGKGNGEKNGA
ncbi:Uncharacterised protein [uncultured archaeon]|nr:Uncharacterised protein [uncultured archaeon]